MTSSLLALPDPYFGLLSHPPGKWRVISYGQVKAMLLQGSRLFQERGYNLISTYGGGRPVTIDREVIIGYHQIRDDLMMVPITKDRLWTAFRLWFYGQCFKRMAHLVEVIDDEGDFVDYTCNNTEEVLAKATSLAAQFLEEEAHADVPSPLSCDESSTPVLEHGFVTVPGGSPDWDDGE